LTFELGGDLAHEVDQRSSDYVVLIDVDERVNSDVTVGQQRRQHSNGIIQTARSNLWSLKLTRVNE